MRPLIAAVSLLFILPLTSAAEEGGLIQGAERALTTPVPAEAFLHQFDPSAAFDGENFFVVWADRRKGTFFPDIHGTRVSRDGVVLDPANVPIVTANLAESSPRVVWTGDEYLMAYNVDRADGRTMHGVRIDRDATTMEAHSAFPNARNFSLLPPVLAAGESTTALAVSNGGTTTSARVFSRTAQVPGVALAHSVSTIVFHDSFYFFFGNANSNTSAVRATVISQQGDVEGSLTITAPAGDDFASPAAASSGSEILVAVPARSGLRLFLVDGELVRDVATIEEYDISSVWINPLAVAWNGSSFVVAWIQNLESSASVLALRVTRSGMIRESPVRIREIPGRVGGLTAAGGNGAALFAWEENDDSIQSVVIGEGGSLDPLPQPFPISRSARAEVNPAVIASGNGYLVAWEESAGPGRGYFNHTQESAIVAAYVDRRGARISDTIALDGEAAERSGTSLASSDAGEVAVWTRNSVLFGARLRNGIAGIETEHFSLEQADLMQNPAIASAGSGYLIAYSNWDEVRGVRLGPDLTPLDLIPLELGSGNGAPRLLPSGDGYLLLSSTRVEHCEILCTRPPPPEIYLREISAAGTIGREVLVAPEVGDAAFACGEECLVAWRTREGIAYRIVSADLDSLSERRLLPTGPGWTEAAPSVTRVGNRFLIAWDDIGSDSKAARLATIDARGEVLGVKATLTTSDLPSGEGMIGPEATPAIASRDGSALVIYGHIDPSPEAGGVRRLFTRFFSESIRRRTARR